MSKVAFVFPGQGAQFIGMGKDLYQNSPAAKKIFDLAESIRQGTTEQCFNGPADTLSLTLNTQPCMFTVSVAHAESLKEQGITASAVAGFSVGELAALTYAEVFSFEDGFKTVIKRAELMHSAAQKQSGTMAAVLKLPTADVVRLCCDHGVYAVNFNCPSQTVVAGESENMTKFCAKIKQSGGVALPLSVSGAFHSPFMDGAAAEFAKYLELVKISAPAVPVYANSTAKIYENKADSQSNKKTLAGQINAPVLWQKTVENMLSDGITEFVETQPGRVLTGLIAKIRS